MERVREHQESVSDSSALELAPQGIQTTRYPIGHVIHHDDAVCATVVRRCDGPEPLLASRVPLIGGSGGWMASTNRCESTGGRVAGALH